jgi:hypothetical protein
LQQTNLRANYVTCYSTTRSCRCLVPPRQTRTVRCLARNVCVRDSVRCQHYKKMLAESPISWYCRSILLVCSHSTCMPPILSITESIAASNYQFPTLALSFHLGACRQTGYLATPEVAAAPDDAATLEDADTLEEDGAFEYKCTLEP